MSTSKNMSGKTKTYVHGENTYFQEARRLGEEDRKRRLLGGRPIYEPSFPNTNTDSARITPGGLYEASSVDGLSPGFSVLKNTRHVFIQRAGNEFIDKFYELENRFDLLNTTGERIFFAGETIQAALSEAGSNCLGGRFSTTPFDVSVVGCNGGGVLSVTSKGGGSSTISDFRNVIGTISKRLELSMCSCCCGLLCGAIVTYSVKDKSGVELYRIGPRKKESDSDADGEYNVFTANMQSLTGRVSRRWMATDVPGHALWNTAYGISFPEDTSEESKAILLGCLISLVGYNDFKDLGGFKQRDY